MIMGRGELQLIDRARLVMGKPLKGDLHDAGGAVLICAGTTLTPDLVAMLGSRMVTGLYGGSEWTDQAGSPTVPAGEVISQLDDHESSGGQAAHQRAHERHAWGVPLSLLIIERTTAGHFEREVHSSAVDISQGGFAFMHRQYVAIGARIRAQFDKLPNKPRVEGVVRSCRLLPGRGHQIGVRFVQPGELPDAESARGQR